MARSRKTRSPNNQLCHRLKLMIRLSLEAQQCDVHQDDQICLLTDHTTISLQQNLLQKASLTCSFRNCITILTLTLLTWTIWRAPTNASKWRMGFNSAFKGLRHVSLLLKSVFNVEDASIKEPYSFLSSNFVTN